MLNPKIRMALIMKTIPNEDLQDEHDQKKKICSRPVLLLPFVKVIRYIRLLDLGWWIFSMVFMACRALILGYGGWCYYSQELIWMLLGVAEVGIFDGS